MEPAFRFLSNTEFLALDVKAKAMYLVRANQELEAHKEILDTYREHLAVQLAAMIELGDKRDQSSGSRT